MIKKSVSIPQLFKTRARDIPAAGACSVFVIDMRNIANPTAIPPKMIVHIPVCAITPVNIELPAKRLQAMPVITPIIYPPMSGLGRDG
jgi:hypothetical protein